MRPRIIAADPFEHNEDSVNYFTAEEVQPEPDAEDWRLEFAAEIVGILTAVGMLTWMIHVWDKQWGM